MPVNKLRNALAVVICLTLVASFTPVTAEEPAPVETAAPSGEAPSGIEVEGVASDEDEAPAAASDTESASIAGLKPLYRTKIKPFTATGTTIRMRLKQDKESEIVCLLKKNDLITIYKVYPAYVLAEFEGNVGFVVRTWIDENCENLDPVNNPPYGVVPMSYVATATAPLNVYTSPSTSAPVNDIVVGAGSKISVIEFVNGFAKVLYYRSYGYIDARLLTDLVVVSPTETPMSEDTPIAAFCSFFPYNTGAAGNDGRCRNIVRSCELMTRTMAIGESLNFNSQIGPYKKANGYFPAPVLIAGGSQLGYGGGTCQSSSTLYNTVRQLSGITVLMRRPHGPGCARYLPMHQDAAVGSDSLNFIFRNDCEYPIRIVAESTGQGSLCIQVFRAD